MTLVTRALLLVAAAWQAISWVGRISLLAGDESWWSWFRIVGNLVVGALVLVVALGGLRRLARSIGWLFLAVVTVTWVRSVWVVWTEVNTPAFRLVHTVLGAVAITLGVLVTTRLRRDAHFGARRESRGKGVA